MDPGLSHMASPSGPRDSRPECERSHISAAPETRYVTSSALRRNMARVLLVLPAWGQLLVPGDGCPGSASHRRESTDARRAPLRRAYRAGQEEQNASRREQASDRPRESGVFLYRDDPRACPAVAAARGHLGESIAGEALPAGIVDRAAAPLRPPVRTAGQTGRLNRPKPLSMRPVRPADALTAPVRRCRKPAPRAGRRQMHRSTARPVPAQTAVP